MILWEVIFWLCGAVVVYAYAGYAVLLRFLPPTPPGEICDEDDRESPAVTMIIAAYNEESFIRRKVENSLAVSYDPKRYRVVVVSDGSEDETNAIVGEFDDSRLTFIELSERGGKANALNHALRIVDTGIVVFTDANVFIEPDAVSALVGMMADDRVGAVTGMVELESLDDKEPLGEGAYMRYERYVQSLESDFWSVAGVDGALFAVRRNMVSELLPDTVLDDFTIGIKVSLAGKRVKYQPDAKGVEQVPAEVSQEFRRKTRIAAGNFQVLSRLSWVEFFSSPARFQLAFVSHKALRWYVPVLLLAMLSLNVLIADRLLYQIILAAQVGFYSLAGVAHFFSVFRQYVIAYLPYYFTAMNLALLVGWVRHQRNAQQVTWNRVDR